MKAADSRKELIKLINSLRYKYGVYDVFRDFCELSALSLSNAVDRTCWQEREDRYMQVIGKYSHDEAHLFGLMLGRLTATLEETQADGGPEDVLGQVFMELEISNKDNGQFFTPQSVCDLMGQMNAVGLDEIIAEHGYVTLQEPAVGGGAMIFGFCKAMRQQGFDYTKQLYVEAVDIDGRCADMCYVQASLYGIPGIIYHGDTLRMQMRSAWVTPVYIFDGWFMRRQGYPAHALDKALLQPIADAGAAIDAVEQLVEQLPAPPAVTVNKRGQLELSLV